MKITLFYSFLLALGLFSIDHLCLSFLKKFKEKKKRQDKKNSFKNKDFLKPNDTNNNIIVDDPLQSIEMGHHYEVNCMPKEAIKYYEKAIKGGAKKQVVYYFLHRVYEEEKMYDQLVNLCNDISKEDPHDLMINESLYYFYQRRENPDIEKAYYYFKQVKKIEKINKMMIIALEEEKNRRLEEAIKKYKEIINFDPSYSPGYKKLANLYRRNGSLKSAIKNYEVAIKINPQDLYSKLWLGIILGMKERKEEAQILLNEVISTNLENNFLQTVAYYVMDYLESNHGHDNFKIIFEDKLSNIINELEEETSHHPSDFKIYWRLGIIYFLKEMFSEMKQKFEKVININPLSNEAKFAYGLINSLPCLIKQT
ncbi:hypothetical protein KKB84_05490 [bacterium]|nr:hypothetical protein [bacterium]MBU1153405.1 hypothetical protein [bacterium]MBU2599529.1 hypothetical protein [bacterium]